MPDTQNIIDSGTAVTILKWAITILFAGFIAQFGKKLANFITEKIRNIRREKTGEAGAQPDSPARGTGMDRVDTARLKLKKKIAKAAAKERKKGY